MNTQIYEEASDWFVDFRSGDVEPAARKRFDAWLRKSPEHLRAYLEITEIWQDAADVKPDGEATVDALIARARADDNIVRLEGTPEPVTGIQRSRTMRRPLIALAASVALAMVAGWVYSQRDTYATGTGEQRSVILADGSVVQLNARSRIKVHYTAHARDLELAQGQALFRVARDPSRPFVVSSGSAKIQAVGTQFDVYRRRGGTVVTVLEGNVVVTAPERAAPGAAESQRQPLAAGEQLMVKPQAALKASKVDVASVTAWTQYRLVFKSSPLPDVVEEFNRYNTRPLVIRSDSLADFRISGVYTSTDPALLVRFLGEQPGIRVRETGDAIVISAASEKSSTSR